jgi:hypothetical protein
MSRVIHHSADQGRLVHVEQLTAAEVIRCYCPTCGAEASEPCTDPAYPQPVVRRRFHRERRNVATYARPMGGDLRGI